MSQFPAVITLGFSFMEAIVCDMIVAEANSTGSFLRSTLFFLLLTSSLFSPCGPVASCAIIVRDKLPSSWPSSAPGTVFLRLYSSRMMATSSCEVMTAFLV